MSKNKARGRATYAVTVCAVFALIIGGGLAVLMKGLPDPSKGIFIHPAESAKVIEPSTPPYHAIHEKSKKQHSSPAITSAPTSSDLSVISRSILSAPNSPRSTALPERKPQPDPSPDEVVNSTSFLQPKIIERVPVEWTMDEGATTKEGQWNFDGKVSIGDNQLPGKNIIYHYLGDQYDIKVYWIKLSKDVFTEYDELAQAFTENSIRKHFGKYSGQQPERGQITEIVSKNFPQTNNGFSRDGYIDFRANINNAEGQGGCQGRAAYHPGEFFMIYGINYSGSQANDLRIAKIITSAHWRE